MSRSLCWTMLATMVGCGTQAGSEDPKLVPGSLFTRPQVATTTSLAGPSCDPAGAPGSVLWELQLPAGAGGSMLASDAAGDVLFANGSGTHRDASGALVENAGVMKYDGAGRLLYTYPHGSVATLDAAGNAYIAGPFTAPIDLGGVTLSPMGNIDAFLVKLDPRGHTMFATQLGLCGDDLTGIAVDARGEIAVSGTAMGTARLDAQGQLVRQLDIPGAIAFDSQGNLVLAGSFSGSIDLGGGHVLATTGTADTDGFVAKLDAQGNVVFSKQFSDAALPLDVGGWGGFVTVATPRDQVVSGVAVGPHDEIGVIGSYRYEMALEGQILKTGPSFPSGEEAGTFVAELDPAGSPMFAMEGGSINAELPFGGAVISAPFGIRGVSGTNLAIDALGNLVVSGNTPGNAQGPFAYPQLTRLAGQTGDTLLSLGNGTGVSGYNLGVATDACGNIFVADNENTPSLFDQHTFLRKLAP